MPFSWGAFAGGLSQGIRQGQELKLRADEAKLKAKMLEHQMKALEFDQQQKMDQARILGQAAQPFLEATPGYESEAQQMSVAPIAETNPARLVTGAAIRSGKFGDIGRIQEAFETPQQKAEKLKAQYEALSGVISGMGGQTGISQTPGQAPAITMVPSITAKGQPSFRGTLPREALGAESRQFADYQKARRAEGWTDDQIREGWREQIGLTAGARTKATEETKVEVRGSPKSLQATTAQAAARTAGQPLPAGVEDVLAKGGVLSNTIADVRRHFHPEFLGPIKGTDTAFSTRRRIGSLIGSPLTEQEVRFRQGLADSRNLIVYLLSGKQINEAESVRLNAALPAATDEPKTFLAGLKRFEDQMDQVRREHIKAGTATRSEIGRAISPPPLGWRRTQ